MQSEHQSALSDVHRVRLSSGTLRLRRYRLNRRTYTIANKTDRVIDLFLDHRFIRGYELVDTPKPVERTDSFLRFRFDVPAKQTLEFVVSEKGEETESISISTTDTETFAVWLKNGYIDETTHERLAEIAALVTEIGALGRQIESHEAAIKKIFENQGRLRENLKALGTSADEKRLRERYVSELAAEEDKIGAMRKAIEEIEQDRKAKETAVRSKIAALTFDSGR